MVRLHFGSWRVCLQSAENWLRGLPKNQILGLTPGESNSEGRRERRREGGEEREREREREQGGGGGGLGGERVQATAYLKTARGGCYAFGPTSALEHSLAIGPALSSSPARTVWG